MPSYNKTILIGNFTRDPELRMLPNNTPVCDFGLAVNDRFLNNSTSQWEERPNFIDCTAFGKTAENIAKFFSKGRPIFVEGKLRFEQWEDRQSGQKRSKIKVVVQTWQFVDSDKGGDRQPANTRQAPASNDGWDDSPVDDSDIPF